VTDLRDLLAGRMKDPADRLEYDALEPKLARAVAMPA
jgi:hypothetical protein